MRRTYPVNLCGIVPQNRNQLDEWPVTRTSLSKQTKSICQQEKVHQDHERGPVHHWCSQRRKERQTHQKIQPELFLRGNLLNRDNVPFKLLMGVNKLKETSYESD